MKHRVLVKNLVVLNPTVFDYDYNLVSTWNISLVYVTTSQYEESYTNRSDLSQRCDSHNKILSSVSRK